MIKSTDVIKFRILSKHEKGNSYSIRKDYNFPPKIENFLKELQELLDKHFK